jgi:hypothetical protein
MVQYLDKAYADTRALMMELGLAKETAPVRQ